MKWLARLTCQAEKMLLAIADQRIRAKIGEKINGLEFEPEKQGKQLIGELSEYRSVRAARQRYRIIYSMNSKRKTVFIVAIGIRKEGDKKDIYALAKKLVNLKLL